MNTTETPVQVEKKVTADKQPKPPKANCRRCFGRGYIGHDATTKQPIHCSCTWDDNTRRAWNTQQELARRYARK